MSTEHYIEENKEEEVTMTTRDQEEKLLLVIEKIKDHCHVDSQHEDLRKVAHALKAGHNLRGKILSGGYTNYSYKIFLDKGSDVALFAKVAFAHALWSQDKPFDLNRQTYEFNLMKEFSDKMGGPGKAPVATPYLLIDVSTEIRILVAQWAPADEQWGNQFIEGEVDRRVLSRAAETLATINLSEFDPNLNKGMKDDYQKLVGAFEIKVEECFQQADPKDDFVEYLQHMGRGKFNAINEARIANDKKAECLIHGDAHVFNCLVEAKPDVEKLGNFGEKGSFYLCDWEMARPGSRGHDVGLMFAFPMLCSYFHAVRGHTEKALDIIDCLREFWDHYEHNLVEKGNKDAAYIAESFRASVANCGTFTVLAFYVFGCFTEFIDKEGLTPSEISKVMGRVGLTGLKFMELGFIDTEAPRSIDGLRHAFHEITTQNIQMLSEIAKTRRRHFSRRSSLLRASGRRVSDASIRMEALDRNSIVGREAKGTIELD
jgi:hypothetical protein